GVVLAMLVIAGPGPVGLEQAEMTVGAADKAAVVALGVYLLRAQAIIERPQAEILNVVAQASGLDRGGQECVGAASGRAALDAGGLQKLTCIEGAAGHHASSQAD